MPYYNSGEYAEHFDIVSYLIKKDFDSYKVRGKVIFISSKNDWLRVQPEGKRTKSIQILSTKCRLISRAKKW